ncbi:inactive Rho GTPase-activating protein 11B [Hoplias malabaricus]|uniref:inactive Rho GTPase-activating protein 11B n=1 Tax=Hoplias malabaricus TaxID=27720 RepID=UPI0034619537
MRAVPGQRERVLAVVRALKMSGVRVRNWKNFIQTQNQPQEMVQPFAFGRELNSLPQHHLTDPDGTVPLFLVEVCEYLSHHLHTEGLFRKTGSLSRIRALRVALEQGECVLRPPRDALLQPCDVASLLKQFLRELPEPLITVELQSAMIQAQTLENPGALEKTTLLVTTLLPPLHARTLRYLCTFLRRVSLRCDENRMEVGNLALVMAPNLLQSPFQNCRLTTNTEKQLDQQTAVIRTLILHAEHIGVLPAFVLDSVDCVEVQESTPVQSKKPGLSVYRSVRRQRRRSVGEMFVDAFSKLKPVRTPTGAALTSDASLDDQLLSTSPNPQSPSAVKRKASEEPPPEEDGSAKKR